MITAGKYYALYAQSPDFSIFDSFEKPSKAGEGKVLIHQSESLKQLVGTKIDSDNIIVINNKTHLITQGYRIQVYSGNNHRTSRDEATAIQNNIKELYPDLASDVKYYAPVWRLFVGNFRSFEEAELILRELRSKFPKIKNELYTVESEIYLPLD